MGVANTGPIFKSATVESVSDSEDESPNVIRVRTQEQIERLQSWYEGQERRGPHPSPIMEPQHQPDEPFFPAVEFRVGQEHGPVVRFLLNLWESAQHVYDLAFGNGDHALEDRLEELFELLLHVVRLLNPIGLLHICLLGAMRQV